MNLFISKGISIGESKPNFNVFLQPIVQELKLLEYGFEVEFKNVKRDSKFFLINAVFDKPARAAILNINNPTGFYGCLKCEQPGETLKTEAGC